MSSKKITIKDIAERARVSYQTVSRVLNNRPDVSDETRARVWEIIEELEYRPSAAARSLRTNMTYTLGMLQNDITNPFYGRVVQGVEEIAIQNGYSVILCNTNNDPERELHYLKMLQSKQVDGIIVGPMASNAEFIIQLSRTLPVVLFDRDIPDSGISAVIVDNESSAYQATRRLIEKGHRHIGLVGWAARDVRPIGERVAGYRRALAEAGQGSDECLVQVSALEPEVASHTVEDFIKDNPQLTAIFALNNQLGFVALMILQKLNLKVPADIALIVFDDLPYFSLHSPAVTVVKQPEVEIGRCAAERLLQLIANDANYEPEVVMLDTELIFRESV